MGTAYAFLHWTDPSHWGVKFKMLEQHQQWRLEDDRMAHPPLSIATKPWIDVHEYWRRRWTSLSAKHSGKSICIGMIEFFLWQLSGNTARDSDDQHHATFQQDHICREVWWRFCLMFGDWIGPSSLITLRWDIHAQDWQGRHVSGGSNHYADVSGSGYPQGSIFVVDGGYLLHQYVCGYCLSMRHTATCTRCAMYKNTSALAYRWSSMDTAMSLAQKAWNKSDRKWKRNILTYISRKICP